MLGMELPATVAFNYPTISGMARYIAERTMKRDQKAQFSGVESSVALADVQQVQSCLDFP